MATNDTAESMLARAAITERARADHRNLHLAFTGALQEYGHLARVGHLDKETVIRLMQQVCRQAIELGWDNPERRLTVYDPL